MYLVKYDFTLQSADDANKFSSLIQLVSLINKCRSLA